MHNFTKEFYAPPVVMVTANHRYDSKNVYSIKPENNALNTWIEVSCQYCSIFQTRSTDDVNYDKFILFSLDNSSEKLL